MNWGTLSSQLGTLLGDPDASSYDETLRVLAWNRACQQFALTHTARIRAETVTGADYLNGKLVEFPTDFIYLAGVEVAKTSHLSERWLEPFLVIPGYDTPTTGYMEVGTGIYVVGQENPFRLWYYGDYEEIVNASSLVTVPSWSIWPLINLTMSLLLNPAMMNQQNLRSYQSKREAGDPEDSPPRKQAEFYLKQYVNLVSSRKPQDREIYFRAGAR